ncbi:MAG: thioredoxin family protein [Fluviicola sp.]|nr:thioredoxin family protein [Fluviicola sp.]
MKLSKIYFLGFVLIALGFLSSAKLIEEQKGLSIGDTAPLADQQLKNIDEKTRSLNDSKLENGLVVVFSCNTCPFVVGSENFAGWELQYNQLAKSASTNKLGFVLINSNEAKRENEDSFEAMQLRAKEKQYSMPYLLDNNHVLADAFGAKTTPHVYVFDKDMKLVYQGAIDNTVDGKRKKDDLYLMSAMNQLAAGTEITINTTPPRGCSIKRMTKN